MARSKKIIQNPENRSCVNLIPYNSDWILYYSEYEALKGENPELQQRLNLFFNNIIRVNTIICLRDACDDYHSLNTKSWIERKETVILINELCKGYYYIIENYVYVWLLRHNIEITTEKNDLQREIADWLFSNAPEIKEKIKYPDEKRI